MLLRDFQTVVEIDHKISGLHSKLQELYEQRAFFVSNKLQENPISEPKVAAEWMTHEYDRLQKAWALLGITIPAIEELNDKFLKGHQLIQELSLNHPELDNKLSFVLVPPSNLLSLKNLSELRSHQPFVKNPDIVDSNIKSIRRTKKWRVIVMYTDVEGLYLGTAREILDNKLYLINSVDTRSLGLYEYIAFSLQHPVPLDLNGWSLFFKDYTEGDIPSVSFMGGSYHIEFDDIVGVPGSERFRPAVEIL